MCWFFVSLQVERYPSEKSHWTRHKRRNSPESPVRHRADNCRWLFTRRYVWTGLWVAATLSGYCKSVSQLNKHWSAEELSSGHAALPWQIYCHVRCRWLLVRPVEAAPPGWVYRTAQRLRHNISPRHKSLCFSRHQKPEQSASAGSQHPCRPEPLEFHHQLLGIIPLRARGFN